MNIHSLNLGFVNAYLLRPDVGGSGQCILVDTGVQSSARTLLAALQSAGCDPASLGLIVLTHYDRDHSAGAKELRRISGAPIAAHRADAEILHSGVEPKRTLRSPLLRFLFAVLTLQRTLAGEKRLDTLEVDIRLEDGFSLADYGWDAEVVHLPGHTAGSIALLDDQGRLVCGDVLTNRKGPGPSPFVLDAEAYVKSLDRLKNMTTAAKMVYPGHGAPFAASFLETISLGG